jgi:cation diffusion facilitator family transporter
MSSEQPSSQPSDTNVSTITWVALVGGLANVLLAAIKIAVGMFGHSQSLVADGIHSLSDLWTDMALVIGVRLWTVPPDDNHPYGHGRVETLVNLFIGGIIFAVAVKIVWNAIIALDAPPEALPSWAVMWVALLSIVVKEILYRWTAMWGRRAHSTALIANAWHHRSDALSSAPVILAVIGSRWAPHFHYLDQLAALLVGLFLMKATFSILWPSLLELLETHSEKDLEKRILGYAEEFPSIHSIHKIRSRRLGSTLHIDLHALVSSESTVREAHDISTAFKWKIIEKEREVVDVLIHIEPESEAILSQDDGENHEVP